MYYVIFTKIQCHQSDVRNAVMDFVKEADKKGTITEILYSQPLVKFFFNLYTCINITLRSES